MGLVKDPASFTPVSVVFRGNPGPRWVGRPSAGRWERNVFSDVVYPAAVLTETLKSAFKRSRVSERSHGAQQAGWRHTYTKGPWLLLAWEVELNRKGILSRAEVGFVPLAWF